MEEAIMSRKSRKENRSHIGNRRGEGRSLSLSSSCSGEEGGDGRRRRGNNRTSSRSAAVGGGGKDFSGIMTQQSKEFVGKSKLDGPLGARSLSMTMPSSSSTYVPSKIKRKGSSDRVKSGTLTTTKKGEGGESKQHRLLRGENRPFGGAKETLDNGSPFVAQGTHVSASMADPGTHRKRTLASTIPIDNSARITKVTSHDSGAAESTGKTPSDIAKQSSLKASAALSTQPESEEELIITKKSSSTSIQQHSSSHTRETTNIKSKSGGKKITRTRRRGKGGRTRLSDSGGILGHIGKGRNIRTTTLFSPPLLPLPPPPLDPMSITQDGLDDDNGGDFADFEKSDVDPLSPTAAADRQDRKAAAMRFTPLPHHVVIGEEIVTDSPFGGVDVLSPLSSTAVRSTNGGKGSSSEVEESATPSSGGVTVQTSSTRESNSVEEEVSICIPRRFPCRKLGDASFDDDDEEEEEVGHVFDVVDDEDESYVDLEEEDKEDADEQTDDDYDDDVLYYDADADENVKRPTTKGKQREQLVAWSNQKKDDATDCSAAETSMEDVVVQPLDCDSDRETVTEEEEDEQDDETIDAEQDEDEMDDDDVEGDLSIVGDVSILDDEKSFLEEQKKDQLVECMVQDLTATTATMSITQTTNEAGKRRSTGDNGHSPSTESGHNNKTILISPSPPAGGGEEESVVAIVIEDDEHVDLEEVALVLSSPGDNKNRGQDEADDYSTDTDHESMGCDVDEEGSDSCYHGDDSSVNQTPAHRRGRQRQQRPSFSRNDSGSKMGRSSSVPTKHRNEGITTDEGDTKSTHVSKIELLERSKSTGTNSSSATSKTVTTRGKRDSVKKGKWSLGSKIGEGSFGVVHVGMNHITGTLMAVKSLKISSSSESDNSTMMEDLHREIDLMRTLHHTNIVRYIGSELDNTKHVFHIFQEWVPGGSVTSLLTKFGPFPIPVVRCYLHQIVSGLAYLHQHRILHRDIKGGNILVNDEGVVKLADFGASKRIQSLSQGPENEDMMESLTMRGTPYFMAPEVFEEKYGSKADVWSVGGVAYQMCTGKPPWKGMGFTNPMSLFLHLRSHDSPPKVSFPNNRNKHNDTDNATDAASASTERFGSLLRSCFCRKPAGRPSARKLLSDPFFTEMDDDEIHSPSSSTAPSPPMMQLQGRERTKASSDEPKTTPTSSCQQESIGVSKSAKVLFPTPYSTNHRRHKKENIVRNPQFQSNQNIEKEMMQQSRHRSSCMDSPSSFSTLNCDSWPTWAKQQKQDCHPPKSVVQGGSKENDEQFPNGDDDGEVGDGTSNEQQRRTATATTRGKQQLSRSRSMPTQQPSGSNGGVRGVGGTTTSGEKKTMSTSSTRKKETEKHGTNTKSKDVTSTADADHHPTSTHSNNNRTRSNNYTNKNQNPFARRPRMRSSSER